MSLKDEQTIRLTKRATDLRSHQVALSLASMLKAISSSAKAPPEEVAEMEECEAACVVAEKALSDHQAR